MIERLDITLQVPLRVRDSLRDKGVLENETSTYMAQELGHRLVHHLQIHEDLILREQMVRYSTCLYVNTGEPDVPNTPLASVLGRLEELKRQLSMSIHGNHHVKTLDHILDDIRRWEQPT